MNRVGGIDELRALVRAGYSPLPDAVGARKDLTSTAKMLFAQLVRYAIAYDTVEVFPSQEALCQRLGVSIKTLYNATKELADEALEGGPLIVLRERRDNRGRHLTYYIRSASVRVAPVKVTGAHRQLLPVTKEDVTREEETEGSSISSTACTTDLGPSGDHAAVFQTATAQKTTARPAQRTRSLKVIGSVEDVADRERKKRRRDAEACSLQEERQSIDDTLALRRYAEALRDGGVTLTADEVTLRGDAHRIAVGRRLL